MTLPSDPLARQAQAFVQGAALGEAYLRALPSRAVHADTTTLPALDLPLPDTGRSPEAVLDLMHGAGASATVATAAGRYFGYVIGGALPAASGARALLSAWDQCANADTGPSVMQMEHTAVRWVIDLLDLPTETEGAFTTGATMANMTLLATARDTPSGPHGSPPWQRPAGRAQPTCYCQRRNPRHCPKVLAPDWPWLRQHRTGPHGQPRPHVRRQAAQA